MCRACRLQKSFWGIWCRCDTHTRMLFAPLDFLAALCPWSLVSVKLPTAKTNRATQKTCAALIIRSPGICTDSCYATNNGRWMHESSLQSSSTFGNVSFSFHFSSFLPDLTSVWWMAKNLFCSEIKPCVKWLINQFRQLLTCLVWFCRCCNKENSGLLIVESFNLMNVALRSSADKCRTSGWFSAGEICLLYWSCRAFLSWDHDKISSFWDARDYIRWAMPSCIWIDCWRKLATDVLRCSWIWNLQSFLHWIIPCIWFNRCSL